ncbi:MAG TPA: 1-deoxy-D-xylulose-5-phosphate reductoisomerase [Syntrophorhabdaceae bacterium]|jgi:1-deoxy-D-xylulose-5-phosphate reductoisomerase
MRKKIVVLGSTGSIGRATLDVIAQQEEKFEVLGLACRENIALLKEQVERFKSPFVSTYDDGADRIGPIGAATVLPGMEGMKEMIGMDAHIVVNALPGSIGLEPTIEALKQNKVLALANKESLVMGGRMVEALLRIGTGKLIPVDSEHSAIYQLLKSVPGKELSHLTITASGGPFRGLSIEDLERVSPAEALNHPTWKMGNKITLDSATMMNKGLEVIEARWLFDISPDRIKVVVHPESIIHGIIEFVDNGIMAYLSYPDMRIPIAYALNEEERHPLPFGKLSMDEPFNLTFHPPDLERFPCLRLAYEALEMGDSALIAVNSANEVAAAAFVEGKISFTQIPILIEEALSHHPAARVIDTVDSIWEIHRLTKEFTERKLGEFYGH